MIRFLSRGIQFVKSFLIALGEVMAWVNTRVLLSLLFYGLITPMKFVMKWSGRQFLDCKWDKNRKSYWEICSPEKPGSSVRQF